MTDKIKKQFMLADRISGEKYYPSELESTWEKIYESFEYGDVFEGAYQLWEYPTGKIFKIEPDRKVTDKDYYSSPHSTLWLPKLTLLTTDKMKVTEAYEKLSRPPKNTSFIQKLKNFLKTK